jgi:hypothetical protein
LIKSIFFRIPRSAFRIILCPGICRDLMRQHLFQVGDEPFGEGFRGLFLGSEVPVNCDFIPFPDQISHRLLGLSDVKTA